jgi:hypothetical protein
MAMAARRCPRHSSGIDISEALMSAARFDGVDLVDQQRPASIHPGGGAGRCGGFDGFAHDVGLSWRTLVRLSLVVPVHSHRPGRRR